MRAVGLVLLAACGRLEFEPLSRSDPDAAADAIADADPGMGLLVWLRMEDNPNDNVLEDSAGGHPAFCDLAGCGATATVGPVGGQALVFDSSMVDFFYIPSDPTLETPNGFTVAMWARVDALAHQTLFTKRFATIHNSWGVYVDDTSRAYYETAAAGPSGDDDGLADVQLGVWMHFAITWDDATKRGYVNGVPVLDMIGPDVAFDSGDILIGCDQDDGTRFGFFTGALDDLRVYNRRLSDFEIQQLAGQ